MIEEIKLMKRLNFNSVRPATIQMIRYGMISAINMGLWLFAKPIWKPMDWGQFNQQSGMVGSYAGAGQTYGINP